MKIALLTPGAGENFYCENCMRDAATLRALREGGHDAISVPLYLPPLDPETGQSRSDEGPIFFGGVNVYLQQKLPLFRHTPRWMDQMFDAHWLLKWAGKKTGLTDANLLGETTVSMLRGEHGKQRKELDRLCEFLLSDPPDVLVFSNALLIGMARQLKERTGAAALCWLQDEDHFLDSLPDPYYREAWDELRNRGDDIDLFLSPSRYYRYVMRERMKLGEDRVVVLPQGVEMDGESSDAPTAESRVDVPTVGFLSQMTVSKGLDVLVEAVARLQQDPALENIRLVADGGETQADRPFVRELENRIERLGLSQHIELRRQFDRPSKQRFLRSISVLAVPTSQGEAFALYILEALAAGVPVVIPNHGGQGELVEETEGGLLFEPNDVASLAATLKKVLLDPNLVRRLARAGREAVSQKFRVEQMADKLAEICVSVRESSGGIQ